MAGKNLTGRCEASRADSWFKESVGLLAFLTWKETKPLGFRSSQVPGTRKVIVVIAILWLEEAVNCGYLREIYANLSNQLNATFHFHPVLKCGLAIRGFGQIDILLLPWHRSIFSRNGTLPCSIACQTLHLGGQAEGNIYKSRATESHTKRGEPEIRILGTCAQ